MSKTFNKYIILFDYSDKTMLALSCEGSVASLLYFTTVIRIPVGIGSASFILVFLINNCIIFEEMGMKKKHKKIALLVRSKLNSIKTISKTLASSEISHDEFNLVINYFMLKKHQTISWAILYGID